jgi:hypothetical protein
LDWLDEIAGAGAGAGDAMSLGISWVIRDKIIGMNGVDYEGRGYYWGGWLGFGVDVCSGGAIVKGGLKQAGKQVAKETGKEIAEQLAKEAAERAAREAAEIAAKELAERIARQSAESVNDKLKRYLLNSAHPEGGPKAKWFEKALGFRQSNIDDLAKQIVFNAEKAVQKECTPHGVKFNQVIEIVGANGKKIEVLFAWIKNNDGVVRLVTAIPSKL